MAIALRDIDLSKNALRDFYHIASHIESFNKIREVAIKIGIQPGIARLAEKIETEAKLPFGDVRDLLRGLLHLLRSAEAFKVSTSDFINLMTEAFRTKVTTEQEKMAFQVWEKSKSLVCDAIDSFTPDDVFLISEKAGRITYAHQNIFKEVQLLTDLRPVFNDEATEIIQVIITHALFLEYYDGTETRRIELTLDAKDVATLKRLCVRAEQKGVAAKESLKAVPWNAIVYNEWDNDGDEQ